MIIKKFIYNYLIELLIKGFFIFQNNKNEIYR